MSRVRLALTLLTCLLLTLSLTATIYVTAGFAPRLFNQQTEVLRILNVGVILISLLSLVVLVMSLFRPAYVGPAWAVMMVVACVAVGEPALTLYDRSVISKPYSKHRGAAYSVFSNGGTFFLEQPNKFSSMGLRTARVEPLVAPAYRVLMLGDSFIEGTEATFAENYAGVLESELRAHEPGRNITVFPAGVNGAGLEEQRFLLLNLIDQGYKFDAVVVHFYLGGDQVNNVPGTVRIALDGRPSRIHTNLFLRYFYPPNFTEFRFLVSEAATQHASEWNGSPVKRATALNCVESQAFRADMAHASQFSYGPGAKGRVDMAHVTALLRDLTREMQRRNLPLVLVLLPDANRELAARRDTLQQKKMDYDWIRKDIASSVNGAYPMLDLTDVFWNKPDLFQCNGIHWSHAGNQVAGDVVAPFLESQLFKEHEDRARR